MHVKILKDFPFSKDGITSQPATQGEERRDIPANLVEGLRMEGFVAIIDDKASDDNKAASAAPENKGGGVADSSGVGNDLGNLLKPQLEELAVAEGIEPSGTKADIIAAIEAGRAAKAGNAA